MSAAAIELLTVPGKKGKKVFCMMFSNTVKQMQLGSDIQGEL